MTSRFTAPLFAPDGCRHTVCHEGYCADCHTRGLAVVPAARLEALERVAAAARAEERELGCDGCQVCRAIDVLDGGQDG
jgi:ribosomal protein L34E